MIKEPEEFQTLITTKSSENEYKPTKMQNTKYDESKDRFEESINISTN